MMTIPRRCRIDLMTPAELSIRAAMISVEEAGAHTLLTEAVILLQQARDKVADFVDGPAVPPADVPAATPIQTERQKHERRMWKVLNAIHDIAVDSGDKEFIDLANEAGCLLAALEITND